MTGDDGMEVLDLDMELDEHALRVFQLHSQPWLKARLQYYKERSDALGGGVATGRSKRLAHLAARRLDVPPLPAHQ